MWNFLWKLRCLVRGHVVVHFEPRAMSDMPQHWFCLGCEEKWFVARPGRRAEPTYYGVVGDPAAVEGSTTGPSMTAADAAKTRPKAPLAPLGFPKNG